MVSEEFYFRIKRSEELEAHWERLYQSFSEKLTRDLPDIVYEFVPRVSDRRDELKDKLGALVQGYVRRAWDCFEAAYHYNFHRKKVEHIMPVPDPVSKEESEKELQNKLENIPIEDHEYYSEIHWESFNKSKHHDDYLFVVYKKIKEAIAENYAEYIQDFNGDCIRMLDSGIYHRCAYWFVDDVYGLVPRPSMFHKSGRSENKV